jgi:hypothetical protein
VAACKKTPCMQLVNCEVKLCRTHRILPTLPGSQHKPQVALVWVELPLVAGSPRCLLRLFCTASTTRCCAGS